MKISSIAASVLAVVAIASCARWPVLPLASGPRTVAGPAGAIYVDDGGTGGLPVVFLHSFAGDSGHWSSQLAHLRHNRRAVAMDLRGHGKSAKPLDGDYKLTSMVKDVESVVDALDLKRFVIVGHSMGGAIAAHYAAAHPERVAGLVLVGAPGKIPAEQARPVMAAIESSYDQTMQMYWEKLLAGARLHVRTQLLAQKDGISREASTAIIGELFRDDPLAAIDRYRGPKLVVYTAQGDTPNDLQNVRPRIPKRHIDGTSHWPHLDKPAEFTRLLDEFLAGIRQ